jgi:PII-like signaling protein
VNRDSLKLTTYFGERDRADGVFLADALFDLYERHGLATSVLLRGIEGFGLKHGLHTQRLLTLSEDLPLVSVAVDAREKIEAAVPEVAALMQDGLLSLERARMLTGPFAQADLAGGTDEATKLTVYGGRAERAGRQLAYVSAVDLARRHGLAGASAIPGVDGTLHGERRRARFLSRNVNVPVMLLCVGPGDAAARALEPLAALFDRPVVTLERVRLCKRDGQRLMAPHHLPERDDAGLPIWQKLMVHASEQDHVDGRPLYVQLVRRLREAGAAGATVLRGIRGFYGDREPFGDRFLSLRRRVPVHTVIVDTPANIQRWWEIVDAVTAEDGIVTSELVPASHAASAGQRRGGLKLASLRPGPSD